MASASLGEDQNANVGENVAIKTKLQASKAKFAERYLCDTKDQYVSDNQYRHLTSGASVESF